MLSVDAIIDKAQQLGVAIPAFNIPYLPMMEPVVQAVVDQDSFALIDTARLEWLKFESKGLAAVAAEFAKWRKPEHVRLHLDHVPVIDEDNQRVEVLPIFKEAIASGLRIGDDRRLAVAARREHQGDAASGGTGARI